MKRLLFVPATLLPGLSAEAEVREHGTLTLDFARARKVGQSIANPGKNKQKQSLMSLLHAKEGL